jgi:hypothetical protein
MSATGVKNKYYPQRITQKRVWEVKRGASFKNKTALGRKLKRQRRKNLFFEKPFLKEI